MYKFQKLEIYKLGLNYLDMIYVVSERLPKSEEYNLKSQLNRAAVSIVLNIAEGSTGQSDAEQVRFLGMALRSLIETVACLDIITRRKYVAPPELDPINECAEKLLAKLLAMRKVTWQRKERSRSLNQV